MPPIVTTVPFTNQALARRLDTARIGYATRGSNFSEPGARRRFAHYAARRGLTIEPARPSATYDLVVATAMSDLGLWRTLPPATRLIFDLVDSYLDVPATDWRSAVRGIAKFAFGRTARLHLNYRRLIEDTCRRANAVVCANEEQRARIVQHARSAHSILDFLVELPRGAKTDWSRREDAAHIVWEGLPWNVTTLRVLEKVLVELRRRQRVVLHMITALERPLAFGDLGRVPTMDLVHRSVGRHDVNLYQWDIRMLPLISAACDLAVIPIPREDPFMWAKPENKLLGFLRMGIPTVTSPTPAYARVMRAAGLDLACHDFDDWVLTLERLLSEEDARREAARRGLAYTDLACDEELLLAKWDSVLAEVLL